MRKYTDKVADSQAMKKANDGGSFIITWVLAILFLGGIIHLTDDSLPSKSREVRLWRAQPMSVNEAHEAFENLFKQ